MTLGIIHYVGIVAGVALLSGLITYMIGAGMTAATWMFVFVALAAAALMAIKLKFLVLIFLIILMFMCYHGLGSIIRPDSDTEFGTTYNPMDGAFAVIVALTFVSIFAFVSLFVLEFITGWRLIEN